MYFFLGIRRQADILPPKPRQEPRRHGLSGVRLTRRRRSRCRWCRRRRCRRATDGRTRRRSSASRITRHRRHGDNVCGRRETGEYLFRRSALVQRLVVTSGDTGGRKSLRRTVRRLRVMAVGPRGRERRSHGVDRLMLPMKPDNVTL